VPRRRAIANGVRLERIEQLARDLGRDLARRSTRPTPPVHHCMADAIQTEIAAVIRALNRPRR
jgi:hypothetical protein